MTPPDVQKADTHVIHENTIVPKGSLLFLKDNSTATARKKLKIANGEQALVCIKAYFSIMSCLFPVFRSNYEEREADLTITWMAKKPNVWFRVAVAFIEDVRYQLSHLHPLSWAKTGPVGEEITRLWNEHLASQSQYTSLPSSLSSDSAPNKRRKTDDSSRKSSPDQEAWKNTCMKDGVCIPFVMGKCNKEASACKYEHRSGVDTTSKAATALEPRVRASASK